MAERQNSIRISSWAAQQVERRGAMGNTPPSQAVVCGRAWCGTEPILPIPMVVLVWYITSLTPMVHGQERAEQMQVLHTVHRAVWGAVPSVYHQSLVSAFYLTAHFVTGTEPILNLCAAPSVSWYRYCPPLTQKPSTAPSSMVLNAASCARAT